MIELKRGDVIERGRHRFAVTNAESFLDYVYGRHYHRWPLSKTWRRGYFDNIEAGEVPCMLASGWKLIRADDLCKEATK